MVISDRLSILVEEKAKGNRKAFAAKAGLKQATFNNYIKKGRPPTADALNNICNTYSVNLNWLVSGVGPKYITDQYAIQCLDPDPKISKILESAKHVLTSGNIKAVNALMQNLNYLEHSIEEEKQQQEEIEAIKKELAESNKQKCEDGKHCPGEQSQDEKAA